MARSTPRRWAHPARAAALCRAGKPTAPPRYAWSHQRSCAIARDSRAFRDWVLTATGWKVDVISGLGRRPPHPPRGPFRRSGFQKRALLIDLGGGSCELTLSISGHIEDMVSLPIGAVRLTQTCLHHDPPVANRAGTFARRDSARGAASENASSGPSSRWCLATSGTPAALSGLYAAKGRGYDESKPHTVPQAAVASLLKELSRRNLSQRRALPGIGPRRAEIIVAGTMVFAELMQLCQLHSFRYLPLGLRDGLLAQMMADYNASTAMRERVESERHDALLAVAKHYGADLQFAQRIRDLALQLFQRLKKVHQLPNEYADWLEAAAMLHEVGAYINRSGRRRHTYYVIANSELFGYTPLQRRLIAASPVTSGKSLPRPTTA